MKYDISVIIPTINRHDVLLDTLNYLSNQNNICFEVIVVDQSENIPDYFLEQIQSIKYSIKYYFQKELSASKARNVGISVAESEIVLFFDDDVIIQSENLLFQHYSNYRDKSVDGVFGQILLKNQGVTSLRKRASYNENYGWLFFPANYSAVVVQKGIGMAGNLSVKKEKAILVGGMDHNFIKGAYREESDFIQRYWEAGNKIIFDPSASIIHIGHQTGGIRSWGASRGLCAKHHVRGEWYFILKHGIRTNLFMNLYCLLRRQIVNRGNMKNPINMIHSTFRSAMQLFHAIIDYKAGFKTLTDYKTKSDLHNDVVLIYEKKYIAD